MDKTVRVELAFAGNGTVYSTKSSGDALAVANRVMNAHREMLDEMCIRDSAWCAGNRPPACRS